MPVSGAPLSGTLKPLSSCTRKQRGKKKSFASLGAPDFFLHSLPASCGALAPFRLCSHSQPQSSPWDLTSEARASASSSYPPRRLSRQASWAGECWSAVILCVGISLLCPPHLCCCALLRGFYNSPSATRSLRLQKGFLVCGNLSSFTAPSHWFRSRPYSLSLFFLFSFALPRYMGSFLPFGRSEVFCQRSVGVM